MTSGPLSQPTPANALTHAVRDIERYANSLGWDKPPAVLALVPTAALIRDEPELATSLALTDSSPSLTPIAQDGLDLADGLESALDRISWPAEVSGVALVLETVALAPTVESDAPASDAAAWAALQPDREDGRLVVGVLRTGERAAVLRWRSHDRDDSVLVGAELAPAISDALARSLSDIG